MGWLTGWTFKKTVSLPSMTADQTDLNYRISVTWEAGMNADFSDIRFCDSDEETLLYQYRKSYTTSTSAVFIIKVPIVPLAGKTVYMYFGNAAAPDVSDGTNTFAFFDDFSGDLSKWDCTGIDVSIVSGKLRLYMLNGSAQRAVSKTTFGANYEIVWYAQMTGGDVNTPQRRMGWANTSQDPVCFWHWQANQYLWYRPNGTTAASSSPGSNWKEYSIQRCSATKRYCSFDGTLQDTQTDSNSANWKIIFKLYAFNYPTAYMWVDWVFAMKLPTDGTEVSALTPSVVTEIYLSKICRECKVAYEHTASVWGTAVEPGQYDEVKVIELGPLGESREITLSKEAGYQWHQYVPLGKKKVETSIKASLRYSGRLWSFLAQLMGLDTVGGGGPYTHTLTLLDAIDGADAFGSLSAILGFSTVGLRFEWPSLKPVRVVITGPDKYGYMEMNVKGIADRLNLGTDTAMDKTDMTAVTHMELNGVLAPIVPFAGMRFRANVQSDGALGSGDILPIKSFELDFSRDLNHEHTSRGLPARQWETAEPVEGKIADQKLSFEFGDMNNLTFAERFQDKTEIKADAYFQFNANYSILFEFPRLKLKGLDPWVRNMNRITHKVELQPMLAAATPAGMSCTNWQVTVVDNNGSAYE